jgi:hypothetical protein
LISNHYFGIAITRPAESVTQFRKGGLAIYVAANGLGFALRILTTACVT